MERKPPATSKLALMLQDPNLLSMNFDYQSMREAFMEIGMQIDSMHRTMTNFEQAETNFIKIQDLEQVTNNVENLNKQIDRNSEDFSKEIRDIRAYFTFQIKEIKSKVDNGLTTVLTEMSKPPSATPTPGSVGDIPIQPASDPLLRAELDNLRDRFESLLTAISQPETADVSDQGEEEEEQKEETAAAPTEETTGEVEPVAELRELPKQQDFLGLSDGRDNTISSPQMSPQWQLPAGAKTLAMRKAMEVKLDDLKIQIEGLQKKIAPYDELLMPLVPAVANQKAIIDAMNQDFMKTKADVLLLKGDVERINENQANSVVDIMHEIDDKPAETSVPQAVDIEKPMLAMRQQFMQQMAMMENAFNEQIRKLKAEISTLKSQQNEIIAASQENKPIVLAPVLSSEQMAEKERQERILREAEEARKKMEEEAEKLRLEKEAMVTEAANRAEEERRRSLSFLEGIVEKKLAKEEKAREQENEKKVEVEKKEEAPKPQEEEQAKESWIKVCTYAEAEVQTVENGGSLFKFDNFTECVNIPSNMVVSVLVDEPPKEVAVTEEKETRPKTPVAEKQQEPIVIEKSAPAPAARQEDPVKTIIIHRSEAAVEVVPPPVLNVEPTTIFEYSEIFPTKPTTSNVEIEGIKGDIERHENVLEQLVEKVSQMKEEAEVPTTSLIPVQPTMPTAELRELKLQTKDNIKAIENIQQELNEIRTLQHSIPRQMSNPPATQAVISRTIEDGQIVNRQIILSPVLFTPLYISNPNVSVIRQKTPKAKTAKTKPTPAEESPTKQQKKKVSAKPSKAELEKVDTLSQPPEAPQRETVTPTSEAPVISRSVVQKDVPTVTANQDVDVTHDEVVEVPKPKKRELKKLDLLPKSQAKASTPRVMAPPAAHRNRPAAPVDTKKDRVDRETDPLQQEENVHEEEVSTEEITPVERNVTDRSLPPDFPADEADELEDHEYEQEVENAEEENVEAEEENEENDDDEEEEVEEDEDEEDYTPMFNEINERVDNHQDQIRILREALVNLRSEVQAVKTYMKDGGPMVTLPQVVLDEKASISSEKSQQTDDNAIRVLRRRFDAQTRDFERDIYDIKKEIMEIRQIQSQTPTTITERIIEVQVPQPIQRPVAQSSSPVTEEMKEEVPVKQSTSRLVTSPEESPRLVTVTPLQIPEIAPKKKSGRGLIIDQIQDEPHPLSSLDVSIPMKKQPVAKQSSYTKIPPLQKPENEDEQADVSPPVPTPTGEDQEKYKPVFNNIIPQQIEELKILSANDEIESRILNLIIDVRTQLQLQVDKNTERISDIESQIGQFVNKDYVQKFFTKVRYSITEINNTVNTMKQAMPERVTKAELQDVAEELFKSLTADNETSGGTTSYRCLLCGKPKGSISGMIKDQHVVQSLGDPVEATTSPGPVASQRGTLIYGPDKQMYRGRGNLGRPTTSAMAESKVRGTLPSLDKK